MVWAHKLMTIERLTDADYPPTLPAASWFTPAWEPPGDRLTPTARIPELKPVWT